MSYRPKTNLGPDDLGDISINMNNEIVVHTSINHSVIKSVNDIIEVKNELNKEKILKRIRKK